MSYTVPLLPTAPSPAAVCQAKTPLTYHDVAVRRVAVGQSFNVGSWNGSEGAIYTVGAEAGVLTSTQAGGSAY